MIAVYKYALPVEDFAEIKMPVGARVLSVATQYEWPQVWALVDTSQPIEVRRFRVAGTGHEIAIGDTSTFVGTFQMHNGGLVFHVFDLGGAL